jgi:hypothetical protein
MPLFMGMDVDCVLRLWAFLQEQKNFMPDLWSLKSLGHVFMSSLDSVYIRMHFTSIWCNEIWCTYLCQKKDPTSGQFVCLSLDFLTRKMPTQHRCAAQKPNKATQANSSSMIRNLKSRNKLTRLTKAADSDCAKNKLSLKEFSTKRKWHMNLKYKNKLDSIKEIPSTSKLLKQKVSFSTRWNDSGFAPSILGLATSILTVESFWNLQNLSC